LRSRAAQHFSSFVSLQWVTGESPNEGFHWRMAGLSKEAVVACITAAVVE
jgi:hypothetical protein